MKQRLVFWVVLILFAAAPTGIAGDGAGIRWKPYKEGIALAKQEGKKIYLHFYADWCTYCKQMDQSTFMATEVMSYLNKHFIPVRVDTDKEKEVARKYNVRPIPDNWFLDGKGERIANRPGYISPGDLYLLLKYYRTDSYKQLSYRKFAEREK